MTRLLIVIFLFVSGLAFPTQTEAACTQGATNLIWTCDTSTTLSEVNTTLSSAGDGATLTFDAGTYPTYAGGTTGITLSGTKAVTFACASALGCAITWTGNLFKLPNAVSAKLYEVYGFVFTNTATGNLFVDCPGGSCAQTHITQFHVHDNQINWTGVASAGSILLFNDGATDHNIEGLFNDNDVNVTFMSAPLFYLVGNTDDTTRPLSLGNANNLFIEDNDIDVTEYTNSGIGLTDGWATFGVVIRFNTIHNARFLTHGTRHIYGWDNVEVYLNTFDIDAGAPTGLDDCYRVAHHQGSGSYYVWGNTYTCSAGYNSSMIVVQHYRSFQPNGAPECDGTNVVDTNREPDATYRGWPCKHQPGRPYNGGSFGFYPVRAWLNTRTDTNAMVSLVANFGGGESPDYSSAVLVTNRDYYNAVSKDAQTSSSAPFDGTTGMGHGLATRKPGTCTATAHADDAGYGGVGYWATDEGDWNTSTSNPKGVNVNGADGVLYECTATDTWTARYGANSSGLPYEYPHPLQGGGGGGSTAPVRLRLTVADAGLASLFIYGVLAISRRRKDLR